jgi:murein DD-endopeptidase MepM/ murein hydrolase activator NlpD
MKHLTALATLLLVLLPARFPARLDDTHAEGALPLTVVHGVVGRNDTLASALDGVLSPARLQQLVEAARPIHDLARISIGSPFGASLEPDGLLHAFTYGIDDLRTLRVVRRGEELQAELITRDYETRTVVVVGAIEQSLFQAIEQQGEDDQLALDLADIFAWDVDFNTEIRTGDCFRVAVEKRYLDGEFVRYGRILAAEFVRGDRVLRALSHEGASGPGYYDPAGRPLRKEFLRSPLRFTRISSRFSRSRLHPILQVRRPHLGVDYAAPTGTPVGAAADGVVAFSGWLGAYGRAIRLRHANGYETLYGHLSRVDVRRGQRVAQGQRIGAVGRTGLATGPHLDYRMMRNGRFVDPLRTQSPPAAPLPLHERPAFAAERVGLLALLDPESGSPAASR